MNLCKYCKDKGYTKEEYYNLKHNIKTIASAIAIQTKPTKGIYKEINNIIAYNSNEEIKAFIIQELKQLGFEFIDDYEYYRY